ncbi:MAG: hypothetical protein BYD32DRAFT_439153 [Podila humilis]|nr:MAG: hypothetical protein BYD32DRAFT_439153 [Podila humilis]
MQAQGQEVHVLVTWVHGHANNTGSILVDRVARAAACSNTTPWTGELSAQTEIPFFALGNDQLLEDDLYNILKQQTTLRQYHTWLALGRTKIVLPLMEQHHLAINLEHYPQQPINVSLRQ